MKPVEAVRGSGGVSAPAGTVIEPVLPAAVRALRCLDRHCALAVVDSRIDLQVAISGIGGVDMVIGGWLVVEADGFENHSDRDAYRNDRRRLDAQLPAGLVTL